MNNQTRYLQDIDRLEKEMKALVIEIEKHEALGAAIMPMKRQYVLRSQAREAMVALVRENMIGIDDLVKEHL